MSFCGRCGPALETRCLLDCGASHCAAQACGLSPRWRELPGPCRPPLGHLRGGGFLGAGGLGGHHAATSPQAVCARRFPQELSTHGLCVQVPSEEGRGRGAAWCLRVDLGRARGRRGGCQLPGDRRADTRSPPAGLPASEACPRGWRVAPGGRHVQGGPRLSPVVNAILSRPSGEVRAQSFLFVLHSSWRELRLLLPSTEPSLEFTASGLAAEGSANTGLAGVPKRLLAHPRGPGPAPEPSQQARRVRVGTRACIHVCEHILVCMRVRAPVSVCVCDVLVKRGSV